MRRSLLFASLFSVLSLSVFAQKDFESSSNTISVDSNLKVRSNKGKSVIHLYPNPSFGKVSVSATSTSSLHFYVFDMEGTMVFQAVLNNKEKTTIEHLQKGTYLYDVFEKDESIEEGKIVIK